MTKKYDNKLLTRYGASRNDPDRDRRARLAVVAIAQSKRMTHEETYEALDMLGLLPGQEPERDKAGTNLLSAGEPACTPTDPNPYCPS